MAERETQQQQRQWSQLPRDLLMLIANKTGTTFIDTLRLRSVCSSWRSSIPPFNQTLDFSLLKLPRPLDPLPPLNCYTHFSLAQSTIYFLQPPPSSSSTTDDDLPLPWLLRVEKVAQNGKLRLLNPVSKTPIDVVPKSFPKSLNLLNFRVSEIAKAYSLKVESGFSRSQCESVGVKRVVVSSSPWNGGADGRDYAVMAIFAGYLAFFKVGDKKWSPIDPDNYHYEDVIYHKGKFYAVDNKGRCVVIGCDLNSNEVAFFKGNEWLKLVTLLTSGDDLYLVVETVKTTQVDAIDESTNSSPVDDGLVHYTVKVEVMFYKLNEADKAWEEVIDLPDQVFFVGDICSYSVSAQGFPGLIGNCVYFPENMFNIYNEEEKKLGKFWCDTGLCNLEDGSFGPLASFPSHWPIFWPPPPWL